MTWTPDWLVRKADEFAARAHAGQLRKWSDEPYIVHPRAVKALVERFDKRDWVLAAALLHDVLEDTPVTERELWAEFGTWVTNTVVELTDVWLPGTAPNRKARKRLETQRLAGVSVAAQTIKVADIVDNTGSIMQLAPTGFAVKYLAEKKAMLAVLTKAPLELRQMATLDA